MAVYAINDSSSVKKVRFHFLVDIFQIQQYGLTSDQATHDIND